MEDGDAVVLYAAGSLAAALGALAEQHRRATGEAVAARFGPSGTLKARVAAGERADLFASADLDHPASLHAAGRAGPVRPFARNALCALVRPELSVTPETLLECMLDPAVRVGISNPGSDPSGDYAWALLGRADALRPGSTDVLRGKARVVAGGPDCTPPPGRSVYAWLLERGTVDLILTYRTNAALAVVEAAGLGVVVPPPALAISATYGLAVLTPRGEALARRILGPDGQAVLRRYGFAAP